MSTMGKYNGEFYKYNKNQYTNDIIFYLKNVQNKKGNIIKEELFLLVNKNGDLIGELSPNDKTHFCNKILWQDIDNNILDQFAITKKVNIYE